MNEQVQAVELLQSQLSTLSLELDVLTHEFNQEVEATIKRAKRSKIKPSIKLASWGELCKYRDGLRDDLRGVIVLGDEHGIELNVCRKLSVALDSGNDPIPFVFDAVVELERLIERLLGQNDPWIKVELKDIKINRSTVGRHIQKFDHIKSDEVDGYYQIRQSKLYLYLTPTMERLYLG